ncbi:hypothetical protein [Enterobacter mori]|uniref:hypothetical protein n=1 Tax=Enterobacter mori TaxID=539813 RepID=UPI001B8D2E99|nr:hypothetical protein [Enterobacter mori]MBS3049635.1 hypothetical protein [Enterobacter mori]
MAQNQKIKKRRMLAKMLYVAENFGVSFHFNFFPGKLPQLLVLKRNGTLWQPDKQAPQDAALVDELVALAEWCKRFYFHFSWQSSSVPDIKALPHNNTINADWYAQVEDALQQMQRQAMRSGLDLVLTERPDVRAKRPWRAMKPEALAFRALDQQRAFAEARGLAEQFSQLTQRFPLHLVLMIQPDSRPQAQLVVNTPFTGVRWRFDEANGRYPVADLLAVMNGNSITRGWDVVTVYDQVAANYLLHQQHIKRFVDNGDNVLPVINASFAASTEKTIYASNLTLSTPRLSFETANLQKSEARLTMEFIKGLLLSKVKSIGAPALVTQIQRISPLLAPKLFMDLDLTKVPGNVTDKGEVELDISTGGNFLVNIVENEAEQQNIGLFFRDRFKEIPPEQRKYQLGGFSSYSNTQLTPKSFHIRTMAAPDGQNKGAETAGYGAIILFTTLEGGTDGAFPQAKDFPWLLPDSFSASLVLSNRVVFEKLFKTEIEDDVGLGLQFRPFSETGSPDRAWKLEGKEGGISRYVEEHYKVRSDDFDARFQSTFNLPMKGMDIVGSVPFTVQAANNTKLSVRWQENNTKAPFNNYIWFDPPCPDEDLDGEIDYSYNYQLDFKLAFDSEGILHFNREAAPVVAFNMGEIEHIWELPREKISSETRMLILDEMQNALQGLSLPSINTFMLRNLLFPQGNFFRPDEPWIPGDLLQLGTLGPDRTSFTIKPVETAIAAGTTFTFTTEPATSGVQWSLYSTEGKRLSTAEDLGHIDENSGVYTAPAASALPEGVRHVVVRAAKEGKDTFALVSVVTQGVAISPSYQLVEPLSEATLQGVALDSTQLTWTLAENQQNSTLTKVSENEYRYTAGPKQTALDYNLERIAVTADNGAKGETLIVVANRSLNAEISFTPESDPTSGRVALQLNFVVEGEDGDEEHSMTGSDVEWKVLESGGADIDETNGIITLPAGPVGDFAVISGKYKLAGILTFGSVIAIPLPFNVYSETLRLACQSKEK